MHKYYDPSISGDELRELETGLTFEEFSDFKLEGELNLPHTYKFELSIKSEVRPALVDLVFNLTDFSFNEVLDFKQN